MCGDCSYVCSGQDKGTRPGRLLRRSEGSVWLREEASLDVVWSCSRKEAEDFLHTAAFCPSTIFWTAYLDNVRRRRNPMRWNARRWGGTDDVSNAGRKLLFLALHLIPFFSGLWENQITVSFRPSHSCWVGCRVAKVVGSGQ